MNLLEQTAIPLSRVPDKVNEIAGFKPNRSTVFRWKTRGCDGRKLATFKAGGRVCTTIEALLEFFGNGDTEQTEHSHRPVNSQSDVYLDAEGV